MNNYQGEVRRRSRNLLIVEGHHEKNKLFWLILRCFPEINIDLDKIWIYGTNIYQLYDDIVKEYGEQWAKEDDDIDLPFVISKKQCPENLQYKKDFTNIILVFDYERHDTNFSEEKILEMQRRFADAADMGRLYINYPMLESYQHLCRLPDYEFLERKIPISLRPGKKYKALVERETAIGALVDFPHRIDDLLEKHFNVRNAKKRKMCCEEILKISETSDIDGTIHQVLQEVIKDDNLLTARHQLTVWIKKQKYVNSNQTYWMYMRHILQQVIQHNICKANRIQYGQYRITKERYKEHFERLDLTEILKEQNLSSKDTVKGFIWILNTCIFFILVYNFKLVME